ncbi:hypothetical protein CLF_110083 [Clonorchis sinensis]|uniref:Reverse transcriptase domain-containing protein n=1 Tax=Clonorchis sinensis TaxID=79923 RepID=G7YK82_CLOSI|nr:hypothetical protein CLF_110083 [Clonorchis sinensis]
MVKADAAHRTSGGLLSDNSLSTYRQQHWNRRSRQVLRRQRNATVVPNWKTSCVVDAVLVFSCTKYNRSCCLVQIESFKPFGKYIITLIWRFENLGNVNLADKIGLGIHALTGKRNVLSAEKRHTFNLSDLEGVKTYQDDAIVYAADKAAHDMHLLSLLNRFSEFNVAIHSDKCTFGVSSFLCLGYVVDGSGFKPGTDHLSA